MLMMKFVGAGFSTTAGSTGAGAASIGFAVSVRRVSSLVATILQVAGEQRTRSTGASGEPFSTVVNNRASSPGAPLASKAIVPSLSDARCSGCWALTAIAHNAIKIIAVSSVDSLNISLLESLDF